MEKMAEIAALEKRSRNGQSLVKALPKLNSLFRKLVVVSEELHPDMQIIFDELDPVNTYIL